MCARLAADVCVFRVAKLNRISASMAANLLRTFLGRHTIHNTISEGAALRRRRRRKRRVGGWMELKTSAPRTSVRNYHTRIHTHISSALSALHYVCIAFGTLLLCERTFRNFTYAREFLHTLADRCIISVCVRARTCTCICMCGHLRSDRTQSSPKCKIKRI